MFGFKKHHAVIYSKNFLIPRIMEIPQPVLPQSSSKSRNCCFSSTSRLLSIDFQDGGLSVSIVYYKVKSNQVKPFLFYQIRGMVCGPPMHNAAAEKLSEIWVLVSF